VYLLVFRAHDSIADTWLWRVPFLAKLSSSGSRCMYLRVNLKESRPAVWRPWRGRSTRRGLTIGRWLSTVSADQRASDVASATAIAEAMPQHFDTAAIYPREQIIEAVEHVSESARSGRC
jgi:hypothetical protein